MLSRRHLRIRVLMALYAWHQSRDHDADWYEKELFKGTERSYDLYLYLLSVLPELSAEERRYYNDLPPKMLQTEPDHKSFMENNVVITWLNNDQQFQEACKTRSISLQQDIELIRKLFHIIKTGENYKTYTATAEHTPKEDIDFCQWLLGKHSGDEDFLQQYLEEKNLWWAESYEFVKSMVLKTLRVAHPERKGAFELMPLFRDDEDDREFISKLLQACIRRDQELGELIAAKTKNWDYDRIALMDTILLKMAVCELTEFSNIPVKVSINEYIDLSKDYSTPKSKSFINGILDKLVGELKESGKLVKTGRGLLG